MTIGLGCFASTMNAANMMCPNLSLHANIGRFEGAWVLQIVDFDGDSLRRTLPAIVKTLEGALSAGGRVRGFM